MLRNFKREYQNARYRSGVSNNSDAAGLTFVATLVGALAGLLGGLVQSNFDGDDGTAGHAVSAIQKDNYTIEADQILTEAAKLEKLKEATAVLKGSGLFDNKDPVFGGKIAEMEKAYADKFSDLKVRYDSVTYKVITDKTLGEGHAEDVLDILGRVNSDIEPSWVEKVSHRGLQECRTLYANATPEQTGRLMADCSSSVSFKEGATFFSAVTTLGFAGGLAGLFGIPAARAARGARRNYVAEKEREKNVQTQVVKERHSGPE